MIRRILLLITDLEIGGTPTVVRELATRLNDPPNVEIEVACLKGWGPVATMLRDSGTSVTPLNLSRVWQFPAGIRRLRALVRERGIDTIISFLIHANALAGVAVQDLKGVRLIQSVQTTQRWPRWHWWLQGRIERAAEQLIVPSSQVAAMLKQLSGISRDPMVIPNAVDAAAFERRAVFIQSKLRAGFIGRMDPVKRLDIAVAAVASITEFPIELIIFGDGPQRVAWESWQERRFPDVGDDKFHWMGRARSPQDALAQMDVLLLPSIGEGFGLVLIEAMASGVPVIASAAGGVMDVVRHEHDGLLVPTGGDEVKGFADAIRRLRHDQALRQRLIENGLATVAERFSWPHVLGLYRRALGLVPSPLVGEG